MFEKILGYLFYPYFSLLIFYFGLLYITQRNELTPLVMR
jgi:hypothetical protein